MSCGNRSAVAGREGGMVWSGRGYLVELLLGNVLEGSRRRVDDFIVRVLMV